jgi:DNA-binding NarL/FixJ family response regulator
MVLALDPEVAIVGEADDGVKALGLTRTLDPDVVLMDVEMPGMDGIAATSELRTIAPRSRVVILTLHDDADMQTRARAAGAAAFVGKCEATSALPAAIRRAVAGVAS